MKRVFLIGDSIRLGIDGRERGYGYHLEKYLGKEFIVYQPDDNCRFAQYTLRYVDEWAKTANVGKEIDLVYWNNGLWDIIRQYGDEPLSAPNFYCEYLKRVKRRLDLIFPNAKIIFAYTTPVIEELANPSFFRKNTDVVLYNKLAKETLEPLGVVMHNIHSVALKILPEHHYDWVHYDETGASMLAEIIAKFIQENIQ